ncbi:TetR/AcrR family transcriptional regulator [Actinomadura sp. 3N407]|uniref:TetR/AcrR family transcriptional regulator n=1 Tax=Actinomadura sp. 3N407 TaxID=3457423 RepID=UPI003FCD998D
MTKAGDARRAAVVARAMDVASTDGFEGLTFGGVAETSGVKKSALQVLFGTKEALQLATLDGTLRVWREQVHRSAERRPEGLAQLRALMDAWVEYLPTFKGGCPFIAAASELDSRSGPVRDAVAHAVEQGQEVVRRQIALATRLGELPAHTDVDQLAYELHALLLKANHDLQLFGHADSLTRARTAIDRLLAT